jgi:hypothetical protein
MPAVHTDQGVNDVGFTISAEGVPGANQITVAVQLRESGVDAASRTVVTMWLSSDATGDTVAADPGTLAVGTDGTLMAEPIDDLVGIFLSEADGDIDVVITHSGTSGFYLNVQLPSGRTVTSTITQFA